MTYPMGMGNVLPAPTLDTVEPVAKARFTFSDVQEELQSAMLDMNVYSWVISHFPEPVAETIPLSQPGTLMMNARNYVDLRSKAHGLEAPFKVENLLDRLRVGLQAYLGACDVLVTRHCPLDVVYVIEHGASALKLDETSPGEWEATLFLDPERVHARVWPLKVFVRNPRLRPEVNLNDFMEYNP